MSDFVLPKHLRFVRSLALVSSAAVGIAAGASLVMGGGCVCTGTPCEGQTLDVPPPKDAAADAVSSVPDASDAPSSDAAMADALPADGGAGGGPLPAPPLPVTWLS